MRARHRKHYESGKEAVRMNIGWQRNTYCEIVVGKNNWWLCHDKRIDLKLR
jgi:hypothetical protein